MADKQKTLKTEVVSHRCDLCDCNEPGRSKWLTDAWVGHKHLAQEELEKGY